MDAYVFNGADSRLLVKFLFPERARRDLRKCARATKDARARCGMKCKRATCSSEDALRGLKGLIAGRVGPSDFA